MKSCRWAHASLASAEMSSVRRRSDYAKLLILLYL